MTNLKMTMNQVEEGFNLWDLHVLPMSQRHADQMNHFEITSIACIGHIFAYRQGNGNSGQSVTTDALCE